MVHSLIAKALFLFTSTTGAVGAGVGIWKFASKPKVLDIANKYVFAKYSNGYLSFWDKAGEDYSLRSTRTQEMRLALSKNFKSLTFTKEKNDLWKELVLFCRKANQKIMSGKDLGLRGVKNIGWCNNSRDGHIPVSKDMNSRDYWADLFMKAKYKASDFEFWGKLSENIGERTAKLHDLIERNGGYRENLLREAKSKCDSFRSKFDFNAESKFVEKDIEDVPLCSSSIEKR